MAIYRPPRSPWRARVLVAIAGLGVGGLLVLLLLPEGEPSQEERAATVRTELAAAEGALEIVAIEYAESVEDGAVVAEAEYEGALSALARSRARYSSVKDEIDPGGSAAVDALYAEINDLMQERVSEEHLTEAIDSLSGSLADLVP